MIVDVMIDRKECDGEEIVDFLIESEDSLASRYGITMAATMVNADSVVPQVRLLNPFKFDCHLREGATIGLAQENMAKHVVDTLFEYNTKQYTEEESRVRCIKHEITQETMNSSCKTESSSDNDQRVPPHLQSLYDESESTLTNEEKKKLENLLTKHSETFSKHENDIGLTNVVYHKIDTGDSRPIKQPPRRVPRALVNQELEAIKKLEEKKVIQKSSSP
ncbi:hypothetical protein FSP39_012309 [Pinctada imbricata]|uniref:Peptidase A9 domain-containing protein n=1 Tax=Pinctada imbricata TaxID=66713 RepID=A0AA88Y2A8_PINIB|nr:hypothetical protein FSP39_012309 [Pinctada imbricata]